MHPLPEIAHPLVITPDQRRADAIGIIDAFGASGAVATIAGAERYPVLELWRLIRADSWIIRWIAGMLMPCLIASAAIKMPCSA